MTTIRMADCGDSQPAGAGAVAHSELDLLRAVVASSIDLKALVDVDYRYLFVNDAYLDYWLKKRSQIVGHTVAELLGEDVFRANLKPLLDRAMAGEHVQFVATFDFPGRGKRRAEVNYSPARDGKGDLIGVLSVVRDVEDLMQAQDSLHEAAAANRIVFEQAAIGIALVELDGRWRAVNDRLCEIVGYPRERLLELTFQDITHPDDLQADLALVARLIEGSQDRYTLEKRYIRADGSLVWIELTVSIVRSDAGAPLRFISVVQDIGARKEAERQLDASRARLADTVEALQDRTLSLQRFVHVLSHDLREPLNTIANFSRLLSDEAVVAGAPSAARYLGYVRTGTERLRGLLDDLLRYVRLDREAVDAHDVDLAAVVRDAVADLTVQIDRAGARIEIADLPHVSGNAALLRLVFQNLMSNAIKFVPPGKAPEVSIDAETAPGGELRVTVRDNGIGIEPALAAGLFQPFVRLNARNRYPGSGLGLAICLRVAELHGGRIELKSTPGAGSRFSMVFPSARQPQGQAS